MGDIDSSDFDLICSTDERGRTVTRKVVTEVIDSEWGSPTSSSNTTSSIVAIIIPVNDKDILELQGRVKTGDMRGLFKVSQTMNNDDIIIDNSIPYRVENLVTMNEGVNDIFQKCLLIRI